MTREDSNKRATLSAEQEAFMDSMFPKSTSTTAALPPSHERELADATRRIRELEALIAEWKELHELLSQPFGANEAYVRHVNRKRELEKHLITVVLPDMLRVIQKQGDMLNEAEMEIRELRKRLER